MNNFNYKYLTPFKWFVLENFPFIEADFDALTEWQLFCKLGKEINKIIDSQNIVGTQMENVTNAFIELQNYVNNYFDNLDVQDEVDNKLNEMAESGQLTDIIAQYLQLAGILAFNTVSDLGNAQNLSNGSFAKTYGKLTYNDGLGAFYKIRTILNTDVIDGDNLVALTNFPTLVAEKMPDATIGDLSNLDTANKTNLVGAINEVNEKANSVSVLPTKPLGMKKVIIIGDSYASRENNWVSTLVSLLGLSSSQYYKSAIGSSGFVHQGQQNKTFLTLLTDVIDNLTTTEKAEITHVIVCGGANDNTHTESDIKTAITTFVTTVNSNLPNAKTLIGEIGWTNIASDITNYGKVVDVYSKCTVNPNCYYLNNVQYTLHNYDLLLSDGVHPTADGNIALASNIHQAIMTGSCEVVYAQFRHKLNENDNLRNYYESLNNNIACVYSNRTSHVTGSFGNIVADGINSINLTDAIFKYVKGSFYETNRTFIIANLVVNGTRRDVPCTIGVYQGILKLYPFIVNSSGGNDTLTNVTDIWLPQFKIVMDSLQC